MESFFEINSLTAISLLSFYTSLEISYNIEEP